MHLITPYLILQYSEISTSQALWSWYNLWVANLLSKPIWASIILIIFTSKCINKNISNRKLQHLKGENKNKTGCINSTSTTTWKNEEFTKWKSIKNASEPANEQAAVPWKDPYLIFHARIGKAKGLKEFGEEQRKSQTKCSSKLETRKRRVTRFVHGPVRIQFGSDPARQEFRSSF